ncbi:MAG: lysylphosphatidylglycerol synthase transmembrane domain-containing protein [Patescibacteria group bacterium]
MNGNRLKLLINLVTFVALGILIYVSRGQVKDAFGELAGLSVGILLLILPLRFLSFASVASIYYSYFKNTGHVAKLKFKEMYRVALELNFINSVFPSGGVSGFSYLGLRLKPYDISVANSTLAQAIRFLMTFVSFLVYLAVGLLLLAATNQASGLVILIGSSIFSIIIGTAALGWYIVSSEERIKAFTAYLPKAINRFFVLIHRKPEKQVINIGRIESVFGEMHDRYMELSKDFGQLKGPFWHSLVTNFWELLTIYMVYLAFGESVNPGAIILAYGVANLAGLVAIFPGGVGVYEGLMASVLIASGIDKDLAIVTTIIYRAYNLLIFVPVGFALYQMALNEHLVKRPYAGTK